VDVFSAGLEVVPVEVVPNHSGVGVVVVPWLGPAVVLVDVVCTGPAVVLIGLVCTGSTVVLAGVVSSEPGGEPATLVPTATAIAVVDVLPTDSGTTIVDAVGPCPDVVLVDAVGPCPDVVLVGVAFARPAVVPVRPSSTERDVVMVGLGPIGVAIALADVVTGTFGAGSMLVLVDAVHTKRGTLVVGGPASSGLEVACRLRSNLLPRLTTS
jgi:hypothetical protein